MLSNFLKEVVVSIIGKPAEPIADLLNNKEYINEFIIAKKLNVTINQTRNILYKLSDNGLVSSIRKKDKKKGWYTYFWKIEILKTLLFLRERFFNRKEQIEKQIQSRESKQFYVCNRCAIEFNEENALLQNFTCHECGDIFTLKDNSKILKEFSKNLVKIDNQLKLIDAEIAKEEEKIGKQKQKVIKKEQRVKEKEKQKKKRFRLSLKKKLKKTLNKKLKNIPKKKKLKKKSQNKKPKDKQKKIQKKLKSPKKK